MVILPSYSYAQFVNTSGDTSLTADIGFFQSSDNKTSKDVPVNNNADEKVVKSETAEDKSSEEDIVVEDIPPSTITLDEIIAIETESKKSIRKGLKNQDTKERENLLGIMSWQEKNLKIRELMLEGKSYDEAKEIAEKMIKIPQIDIKNDKDIEKLIYEKGHFVADEK